MKRNINLLLMLLTGLFLMQSTLLADDWPRWRGPNRNSISKETAWRPEALTRNFTKAWEVQVGAGWSAVAVHRGLVYTMGNQNSQDKVTCLKEEDGSTVWQFAYDSPAGNFPGPRSTPVVDENLVFTLGRNGDLHALNAKTGKLIWHVNVMKTHGAQNVSWGFCASPVIEGDMLIINANTHGIAFNKRNGQTIWASAPGKCGYASAVIYTQNGKKMTAIFGQKAVYGVELATGKALWSYPWETDYDVNAADPVYYNGHMFISSGYNRGCTLLDLSEATPKAVYENKKLCSQFGSFVVKGRYIYGADGNAGNRDAQITCMNIESGEVVWSEVIGNNALMAAGDHLITISERGRVHILKWTHDAFQEVANAVVLPTSRRNATWTAPVLANGRLFCRNGAGQLVAIDLR